MSSFFGGRAALSLGVLSVALLSAGCHLVLGYDDFTDQGAGGSGAAGGGVPTTTTTTTGGDCTGCVDAQGTCQTGDTLAACGASGATCESCDDMSPCTLDACSASGCTHENVEGVCPGGVCENGVCMALEEDCTNGVDDNGDTLIDCADPICTGVGYQCFSGVANGWMGPVAKNLVGAPENGQCLGAYPMQVSVGSYGLVSVPPADCNTVTCGCDTLGACDSGKVNVHENPAANLCSAGCSQQQTVNFSCTNVEPTVAGGCTTGSDSYFAGLATTSAFTGSCQPQTTGAPTLPPVDWTGAASVCGADAFGQGCNGGTCAPPASSPLSPGLCVYQAGDLGCPGEPFTDKTLLYLSVQENRTCDCSCTAPQCYGTITFYDAAGCGSAPLATRNVPASGCAMAPIQAADGALFATFTNNPDPMYTQCQASPPNAGGDATPINPVTVCCQP